MSNPPAVVGFLGQTYRYKSIATQNLTILDWYRVCITQKFLLYSITAEIFTGWQTLQYTKEAPRLLKLTCL